MALLLNIGATRDAYLISYDFPWFKHNQLEQTIVVAYKAYSDSASSNNSARLLTFGHYQSNSSEYLDLVQNWTSAGTETPSSRFNAVSNPSLPSGYNSGNDRLLAINSYYAGSGLRLMATSVELENDLQVLYTTDNKLRAYNNSELVNIAQNLTIGTFNENSILNRAWLGEIYYVAVLNRPLQSEELQSIAAGDAMLLDDYRSNLYELWDFGKAERDEAFTGLISGTVMDAIGTAWSLTGESKYPVSRDTPSCIQGQLGTSIHDAPAWLSTLDIPAAGSETINCSPAALTLTATAAALQASSVLATTPDAITLSPVSASILERVTVLANPAIIDLTGVTASIHITGAIEISAEPATISLSGVNASINLSGQIQIDAKVATATLGTSSATFVQHAVVNTQPDALVLQPVRSGIYAGEAVVDAAAKALTLSPNQAAIVQHGVLVTTPDNIALHGSKAELHLTNVLTTNTANISLYGTPAGLYSTEILSGKPDSILLQGNQALIRAVVVVDARPDNIGILGQRADISTSTALMVNPASMALASLRAQITYESPVVWGSTTIEARLQGTTIEARLQSMTIEARQ